MSKNYAPKMISIVDDNVISGVRYGETEITSTTHTNKTKRRAASAAKRYANCVKKVQDTVRAPLHCRKSK